MIGQNRTVHIAPVAECMDISGERQMTLDGIELRYHVRGCDNRVAIVLSKPGWAATDGYDFWYVSIEDLPGETNRWTHRPGSTQQGGMSFQMAMMRAQTLYAEEAAKGRPEKSP